jgi:hypothetical protein
MDDEPELHLNLIRRVTPSFSTTAVGQNAGKRAPRRGTIHRRTELNAGLKGGYGRATETTALMFRNPALRNAISVALLIVALVGIGTEIRAIHIGMVDSQTRLTLAGYILIAIYAAASIAVRYRAGLPKK